MSGYGSLGTTLATVPVIRDHRAEMTAPAPAARSSGIPVLGIVAIAAALGVGIYLYKKYKKK